jgi:hypothetical protein
LSDEANSKKPTEPKAETKQSKSNSTTLKTTASLSITVSSSSSSSSSPSSSSSSSSHDAKTNGTASNSNNSTSDSQEVVYVTDLIRKVIDQQAEEFFADGLSVLAACVHLSIGDYDRAISKLLRSLSFFNFVFLFFLFSPASCFGLGSGDEVELAFVLVRVLKLQFADHVYKAVAQRAEMYGLW